MDSKTKLQFIIVVKDKSSSKKLLIKTKRKSSKKNYFTIRSKFEMGDKKEPNLTK